MFKGVATTVFFFLLYTCSSCPTSTIHQYFEPVEDERSREYVDDALEYLFKNYGEPNFPVNFVHIRRSTLRENPELLSVADVLDWKTFQAQLKVYVEEKLYFSLIDGFSEELKNKLATSGEFSHQDKVRLFSYFNRLILSKQFHKKDDIKGLIVNGKQKSWRGDGFFGCFTEDLKRLNRNLISSIFKKSLLPFKKLNRLRGGSQSCEVLSLKQGVYVIYTKHKVGTPEFYAELGHEVFHTLDVKCFDWYVEGLASVFSEEFALSKGLTWNVWRKRFITEQGSKPYAASFIMMKEIYRLQEGVFRNFMKFAVYGRDKKIKYIDINKWGESLNVTKINSIGVLIAKFRPMLVKYKKNTIIGFIK